MVKGWTQPELVLGIFTERQTEFRGESCDNYLVLMHIQLVMYMTKIKHIVGRSRHLKK